MMTRSTNISLSFGIMRCDAVRAACALTSCYVGLAAYLLPSCSWVGGFLGYCCCVRSLFHRPPTLASRTHKRWGPPRHSCGSRAPLRRCAARTAPARLADPDLLICPGEGGGRVLHHNTRTARPHHAWPAFPRYTQQWSALLSFAAAHSLAASLLSFPLAGTANVERDSPLLSDLLADSTAPPPFANRMP